MECLVNSMLPKLSKHFNKHGIISASMYQASQMIITVFVFTNISMEILLRIWDIYLNEGYITIFRFGIAYLKYFEKDLLNSDFEKMLDLFRNGWKSLDIDKYIKIAFSFKIDQNKLDSLKNKFLNG